MKITKTKITASTKNGCKIVKSTTACNSSALVDGCKNCVEILPSDEDILYRDEYGAFGESGEYYTWADIKRYWNEDHESDPSLSEYSSFEDWWRDTRRNYLVEA